MFPRPRRFSTALFEPYMAERIAREWPMSHVASKCAWVRCPHCEVLNQHSTEDYYTFFSPCAECGEEMLVDGRSLPSSGRSVWYVVERIEFSA